MPNPHASRPKKHKKTKIKKEKPEEPKKEFAPLPEVEVDPSERDLSHFIRDRVELMRQVFSILKDRELLAMAPDSLRSLKVDDLQELCLDEVLGISSKRLRSVLDGFQCPSDTDTSNDEDEQNIETISLDSISSVEDDILSRSEYNERKKHGKTKGKKKAKQNNADAVDSLVPKEKRTASSSAGMTVLELIELQARARAIRAQLDAVVTKVSDDELEENNGEDASSHSSENSSRKNNLQEEQHDDEDDDVIQIKEEPPEVVEIQSSGDEGGDMTSGKNKKKDGGKEKSKKATTGASPSLSVEQASTSQITHVTQNTTLNESDTNHIHMTQHQSSNTGQPSRKIKLKRNNLLVSVSNVAKPDNVNKMSSSNDCVIVDVDKNTGRNEAKVTRVDSERTKVDNAKNGKGSDGNIGELGVSNSGKNVVNEDRNIEGADVALTKNAKNAVVSKKHKKKRQLKDKKGSDEDDELMLELSYTEKMDILDDFDSDSDSSEHDDSVKRSCENLNDSNEAVNEIIHKTKVMKKVDVSEIKNIDSGVCGDGGGGLDKILEASGKHCNVEGLAIHSGELISNLQSSGITGNDLLVPSENIAEATKETDTGKDIEGTGDVDAENEYSTQSGKISEAGSQVINEEESKDMTEDMNGGLGIREKEILNVKEVKIVGEQTGIDESAEAVDILEVSGKKPDEHRSRSKKSKKAKKKSSSRSESLSESEEGGKKTKRVEKKKLQISQKHLEKLQQVDNASGQNKSGENVVVDNLTILDSEEDEGVGSNLDNNQRILVSSICEGGNEIIINNKSEDSTDVQVYHSTNLSNREEVKNAISANDNLNDSQDKIVESDTCKTKERQELSLSEGECSYSSDGIEITENKPEVVCISDDGTVSSVESHRSKGKKRKYRKRKKRKGINEKSSDDDGKCSFRRSVSNSRSEKDEEDSVNSSEEEIKRRRAAVLNLIDERAKASLNLKEGETDKVLNLENDKTKCNLNLTDEKKNIEDSGTLTDEIVKKCFEEKDNAVLNADTNISENIDDIFEISDESSYEEDTINCLSKEPTTEEIEELSRRVDTEIRREDIVLEKNVTGDIRVSVQGNIEDPAEAVSWKDRWLESDKVKKVLATSSLCNALRKKNKELKKKLAEGLGKSEEIEETLDNVDKLDVRIEDLSKSDVDKNNDNRVDEGSVDQYKTLPGLTKYVDPVKDVDLEKKKIAMTKDAKQLMKMYKKLLKLHNNEEKPAGDVSEKKKKKKKDKKDKKRSKDKVSIISEIQESVITESLACVSDVKLIGSDDIR